MKYWLLTVMCLSFPMMSHSQKFVRIPEGVSGVVHYTYGKVRIVQGHEAGYVLSGNGRSTEAISLSVDNGVLSVEKKWFTRLADSDSVVLLLTLRQVTFLSVSGPGTIEAASELSGGEMSFGNNGSGTLKVNQLTYRHVEVSLSGEGVIRIGQLSAASLKAKVNGSGQLQVSSALKSSFEVRLSGSGRVEISGKVPLLSGVINGSGELNAQHFMARRAKINLSGSGNAFIHAEEVAAKISGSGTIYYVGAPTLDLSQSGNGKLIRLR